MGEIPWPSYTAVYRTSIETWKTSTSIDFSRSTRRLITNTVNGGTSLVLLWTEVRSRGLDSLPYSTYIHSSPYYIVDGWEAERRRDGLNIV